MKEQNSLYALAELILLHQAPVFPVQLFLWQMYAGEEDGNSNIPVLFQE